MIKVGNWLFLVLERCLLNNQVKILTMKVKTISRNPDEYLRETKMDIHKVPRNFAPELHPFQEGREYVRALNATKLERVFAKPFVGSLDGHRDGISYMVKHPTQLAIALSGGYDGEIRIWNLPAKKCLRSVQGHEGYVRGMCVNNNGGDSFLTVGDDQLIKHWALDLQNAKIFETETEEMEPVDTIPSKVTLLDVNHHWKKNQFVTCGDGVCLWDHHRTNPVRSFNWGVDTVTKIRFNPVETELVAGTASDRSLILYDCRGQVPLKKVVLKLRSNAVAWNPMEAYTFTLANEDYNLYTFDMRKLSAPVNIHMDHTEAVMDVDYAPTGREFVSGSYDKSLRIFPVERGRSREVYHTRRMHRVMNVLWSMDNKFLLSGSDEMNIRIWKANAAEKLGPLRPREAKCFKYNEKLKERYGSHPEIRRIARHRHVPKHIMSASSEHRTIRASMKRKEANVRSHSAPGTVPFEPERKKTVNQVVD